MLSRGFPPGPARRRVEAARRAGHSEPPAGARVDRQLPGPRVDRRSAALSCCLRAAAVGRWLASGLVLAAAASPGVIAAPAQTAADHAVADPKQDAGAVPVDAPSDTEPAVLSFTDVTFRAGLIGFRYAHDDAIPEMTGSGVIADLNGDGWQDVFFLSGGFQQPDALFLNNGDGTFRERGAAAGLAHVHRGMAAAAGDIDADGRLDLFVTSLGSGFLAQRGAHRLYRNDGNDADGTPLFTEIARSARVHETSPRAADGMGANFGDYDLDGDLDLFVTGYHIGTQGNVLFANDGSGRFHNVTGAAGLANLETRAFMPIFTDMDGDRYPELLIAGDYRTSLYLHNHGDGTFSDRTAASGTGLDGNGMGSVVADVNNDGLLDWYVTAVMSADGSVVGGTGNMLYLNRGAGVFEERATDAGVDDGGWGWGVVAVDVNHDGLLDLATTNGWNRPNMDGEFEWVVDPTRLFLNRGVGPDGVPSYIDVAVDSELRHDGQGRGMVRFDLDNDGDQDLLIFNQLGPMTLYRNDLTGPEIHWLRVFLDTRDAPAGRTLAPDGFGSRISVLVNGAWQHRSIGSGGGFLGTSELSAHFGLGAAARVDQLRIEWPDGGSTVLHDIAADATLTVTPSGELRRR